MRRPSSFSPTSYRHAPCPALWSTEGGLTGYIYVSSELCVLGRRVKALSVNHQSHPRERPLLHWIVEPPACPQTNGSLKRGICLPVRSFAVKPGASRLDRCSVMRAFVFSEWRGSIHAMHLCAWRASAQNAAHVSCDVVILSRGKS